jgi:hypothetical protein
MFKNCPALYSRCLPTEGLEAGKRGGEGGGGERQYADRVGESQVIWRLEKLLIAVQYTD